MIAQIISLSFVALAIASVIFMIFGIRNNIKGFYIATSSVYLSGTVLIAFLSTFFNNIPISFVVISEISIFVVFAITVFTILKVSRNADKIKADIAAGKVRHYEEDDKEDSDKDWKDN